MIEFVFAILVALIALGGVVLATRSLAIDWFNPAVIFAFSWSIPLIVFFSGRENYYHVSISTWVVIVLSLLTFYLGVFTVWVYGMRCNSAIVNDCTLERVALLRMYLNKRKLRNGIVFIGLLGGIFFIVYIKNIADRYGVNMIVFSLLELREDMRNEGVFPGFHFFYFFQMVLPLTTLYLVLYGMKRNILLIVFALISTLCLLMTGAKVNIFDAIIWSGVVYLLLRLEKISIERGVVGLFFFAVLGISIFLVHTKFTGEIVGVSNQSADIYQRFSAQFPTFDMLINDSSIEHSYGKLSLLPLVKVVHVFFSEVEVPNHILQFYNVPVRFNLATYLDVLYRDFGLAGVVVGPWFFGVLCGFAFLLYRNKKESFLALFFLSIVILWVLSSPYAAGYIKPIFWFQILIGYILYLYIRVNPYFMGAKGLRHT